MALKGTTWTFDNEITVNSGIEIIGLDLFKDPTRKMYKALTFMGTSNLSYAYNTKAVSGTGKQVYKNGAWVGNDYKTITFINEPTTILPDETTFMTWLQANATQTTAEDTFYAVKRSELEYIADSIRGRTNVLTALTFPDGYASVIRELDTSDANATAEEIKSGKTAYVKGEKITGTYNPQIYIDKVSLTPGNGMLYATLPEGTYSQDTLVETIVIPSNRYVEEITDFQGTQYGQSYPALTSALKYTTNAVSGRITEINIYAKNSSVTIYASTTARFGWNGYEAFAG